MQDADAFAALYDREAHDVLVFIARRTLDAELALDLTAETFAQAFRGRRGFRGSTVAEERAWLFTIARRQISRYQRRGVIERRAMAALGASVPHVSEDDVREIEETAGLHDLRAALGEELQRLSDDQRRALQLRVVEERSYPEVASALGVSEQTARARVSRGLRALARALEPALAAEEGR
jgi:RNA polymerase sigma-70 factor (ECF subfamily)